MHELDVAVSELVFEHLPWHLPLKPTIGDSWASNFSPANPADSYFH